jgi:ribosomal protein S18 acetylase RimI-like enzyme
MPQRFVQTFGSWRIVAGTPVDVPSLEALWVVVHRAHAAAMPELAPYVSDVETWEERRALYDSLLRRPDTVLLLALEGDVTVGYAFAHVQPVRDTWIADTWRIGARVAEIESLSVRADRRGRGLGSALLEALERELNAQGVDDVIVGAPAGNESALRLYRRRGFRPTWL